MHLGDLHTLYLRGKRLRRPGWSTGFPELYQHALVLLDHYPLRSYYDQELDEDQGTSLPDQRVRAGEWRRAEWVLKRNDEVRPLIKPRYR